MTSSSVAMRCGVGEPEPQLDVLYVCARPTSAAAGKDGIGGEDRLRCKAAVTGNLRFCGAIVAVWAIVV